MQSIKLKRIDNNIRGRYFDQRYHLMRSEFINEVIKSWDSFFESLSLSDSSNDLVGLWTIFLWITIELFPMIKHTLWECSSGSGSSKGLGETEWFTDWEEAFHVDKWGTSNWFLTVDHTSSLGHCLIDGTNNIIWGLDLDQEDWLLESWSGSKLTSIKASSGSWDDLTTTSVDSVSMEGYIMDIESDTSHVLIAHSTFLGCPLESSFNWVLNFVKELYTLSNINKYVGTVGVWTEAPDLLWISLIPSIIVTEFLRSLLWLAFWS